MADAMLSEYEKKPWAAGWKKYISTSEEKNA